jgi:hypothetical protein
MRIDVKNYGAKITRRLDLPDRGLVLVRAENGAGKTSLLADAPLYAVSGWTGSRGDPLKHGGEVDFELGDLRVKRSRSRAGASVKVQIWLAGKPVDCDTATKADAWLAERLGPAELWEGLLAFRWDAGSTYSCGTDAERKAQTELLVPTLAGFDPAREKVSQRNKAHCALSGPLSKANQAAARAEQLAADAEARLNQIKALPEVADDPGKLRAELAPLEARRAALAQRVGQLEGELRSPVPNPALAAAEQRYRDACRSHQEAGARLSRCGSGDCPTCRRPLANAAEIAAARTALLQDVAAADAARVAAGEDLRALSDQAASDQRARQAELQAEIATLRRRWESVDATCRDLARRIAGAEERARLGATLAAAEERLAQAQQELAAARAELAAQELERQALELADRMLGPRGARAGLLGRAFAVVERLAAERLARAWPGWRLQIARTSETAGGKVREVSRVLGARPDDPELDVVGRYSRGQLRRVDLCLLLARRQVLAAATGCAEMLAEEARKNLVVIISFDERIARGIPFDRVVNLEAAP